MATNAQINVTANTSGAQRAVEAIFKKDYNLNVNIKGGQPLGRITGDLSEFNKSMEAANARVIAFGASASVVYGIQKAFHSLVDSTIEVQKSLNQLQVLLKTSDSGISKFGASLFNVAKQTGQSFETVAEAATLLSRQGLGMEETLKRTNDALILSRITGMDAAKSVQALTAAVNSFTSQAVTASEVVNKFATVDTQFAIGAKDLPEAIGRVGSSAAQAGVSLDQLIGLVTAAQVATARGGAVIGNSFKTIFTRLDRPKTQALLESLGIGTTDENGKAKGTIELLQELAKAYEGLSRTQQAQVAEKVGGVFQINILKATLADLNREYSVYNNALKVSASATDDAYKRNEALNQTYSAQLNALQLNAKQLSANVGEKLLGPSMSKLIGGANSLLGGINESDSNSVGAKIANGILSGLGQVLSGPGLALIGGVLLKLLVDFTKFAASGTKDLLGLNTATKEQADLQKSITAILSKDPSIYKQIETGAMSVNDVSKALLANLKLQTAELELQSKLSAEIAGKVFAGGARVSGGVARVGKASGYIPNFASDEDMEEMHARMLGARNPRAKEGSGTIGGKRFLMNSEEDEIPNFGSNGDSAVIPRYAKGYIPNFAGYTVDEIASFNPRVKNKLLKNDGRLNAQDKINVGGFKEEKVQLKPNESPDQYEERVLGMEKFGFTDNSGLFGKRTSAIDGYKQVGNTLTISEVKSGFYRPEEIITKFARAFPENYDRSPFSSFFTEGLDNIKINGILISPSLVGGNNKEYTKEELEKVKNEQVEQDISKRRKRILRKGLAGGYVPNFADWGIADGITHKGNLTNAVEKARAITAMATGSKYGGVKITDAIRDQAGEFIQQKALLSSAPQSPTGGQVYSSIDEYAAIIGSGTGAEFNLPRFRPGSLNKGYPAHIKFKAYSAKTKPDSQAENLLEGTLTDYIKQAKVEITNKYLQSFNGELHAPNAERQSLTGKYLGQIGALSGFLFEDVVSSLLSADEFKQYSSIRGTSAFDFHNSQGVKTMFGIPDDIKAVEAKRNASSKLMIDPDYDSSVANKIYSVIPKASGRTRQALEEKQKKAAGYIPNFADRVGIVTGDVIRGNEYKAVIEYLANTSKPISTILGPAGVGKTTRASNMGGQLLRSFAEMNRFDKFILDRAGFDLPQKDTITAENIRKIFAKSNASGSLDVLFGSRNTVASLRERRLQEGDQIIGERNNLKGGSSGVGSFTKGIRGFLGEYENANVLRMRKSGNEYGLSKVNFASGYIPNFVDALHESISREIGAGAPKSGIYVKQYSELAGSDNPMGLGVFNSRDEGSPSKEKGAIRRKGYAAGYIPNFADDSVSSGGNMGGTTAAIGAELVSMVAMMAMGNKGIKSAYDAQIETIKEAGLKNVESQLKIGEEMLAENQKEIAMHEEALKATLSLTKEEHSARLQVINSLKADSEKITAVMSNVTSSATRITGGQKAGAAFGAVGGQLSMGATFLAPILAQTLAQGIGNKTKDERVASTAVKGVGDIASYAGTGFMVGGPWGAAAGAVIGIATTVSSIHDELATRLPELSAALNKKKEDTEGKKESADKLMKLSQQLDDLQKNGKPSDTGKIMELKSQITQEISKTSLGVDKTVLQKGLIASNPEDRKAAITGITTDVNKANKETNTAQLNFDQSKAAANSPSQWALSGQFEKNNKYFDESGSAISKAIVAQFDANSNDHPATSTAEQQYRVNDEFNGLIKMSGMSTKDQFLKIGGSEDAYKEAEGKMGKSGAGALAATAILKYTEEIIKRRESLEIQVKAEQDQARKDAELLKDKEGYRKALQASIDNLMKGIDATKRASSVAADSVQFGTEFRQGRNVSKASMLGDMGFGEGKVGLDFQNIMAGTVGQARVQSMTSITKEAQDAMIGDLGKQVPKLGSTKEEMLDNIKSVNEIGGVKSNFYTDLFANTKGIAGLPTEKLNAPEGKMDQFDMGAIYEKVYNSKGFQKSYVNENGEVSKEGKDKLDSLSRVMQEGQDKLVAADRQFANQSVVKLDELIKATVSGLNKVGGGFDKLLDNTNPNKSGNELKSAVSGYNLTVKDKKASKVDIGRQAVNMAEKEDELYGGLGPGLSDKSQTYQQIKAGIKQSLQKNIKIGDEAILSRRASGINPETGREMTQAQQNVINRSEVEANHQALMKKTGGRNFDEALDFTSDVQTSSKLHMDAGSTAGGRARLDKLTESTLSGIGLTGDAGKAAEKAIRQANEAGLDPQTTAINTLTSVYSDYAKQQLAALNKISEFKGQDIKINPKDMPNPAEEKPKIQSSTPSNIDGIDATTQSAFNRMNTKAKQMKESGGAQGETASINVSPSFTINLASNTQNVQAKMPEFEKDVKGVIHKHFGDQMTAATNVAKKDPSLHGAPQTSKQYTA
jgi:TP901 family phage tail tape measure protein